uniref:Phospholipase B1, membrane-associated n=1 Tax=Nomascus leucogenys TaxID=61853 RepID=A0A2I3GJT3_NOMLE
ALSPKSGFLLALLMLFGGTPRIHTSPRKSTLEGQLWPETLKNSPFPCNPNKLGVNMPSKSVHSLKPSDIKFVAAIGNLEIVSQGLKLVLSLVLSDIIRHFSPSVPVPVCHTGKRVVPHNGAEDLWIQAQELVRNMKENLQLDFQFDWKLINVFFSNASQCHLCPSAQQAPSLSTVLLSQNGLAAGGVDELMGVLDYLQQEVPRAFVNLVDLSEVAEVSHQYHGTWLSPAPEPCNCSEKTSRLAKVVMQWSYQEAWNSLLASSRYSEQESFTVVFQPFFYETTPSLPSEDPPLHDPTTLAWHLWNRMMEPAGEKDEPLSAKHRRPMKCPSQESPYLFSYRNSNYLTRLQKPRDKNEVREGAEIRCPDKDPSDTVPTSVHRLKPADINVIGALGDSLTAGNGAGSTPGNVLDVLTQYRGLSWSVGGDESIGTVTTLANILREFNPSLKGFSVGTGKETSSNAFLNQAVAGGRAEDLPVQARRLVDLMKNDTRIHFQEDWKIITLFIGGNDLCDFCNDPVPRAFVNLVTVLEIVALRELYQEKKVYCPRMILRSLCPCVLKFDDNSTELATLIEFNKKFQEKTHQLIESGRYDTREDFTVVVQPFFENVDMPKTSEGLPDNSFFAPDCFHFSSKSHSRAASALWNNMLEPVGQKMTHHKFENEINITCPNQPPFLLTSSQKDSWSSGHGTWLPCRDRAPSALPPTSALHIHSLPAGNGIGSKPDDLPDVSTQYRGLSYSAGGDGSLENVTTLPNILREFNRNLTGYAVGTGDANDTNAFLNQAVPRAKAEDLMSQVQTLMQKMKDDHRVNFHEDWKVITVLIGGSDLCDYCTDSNLYSAANFVDHLRDALDVLHREVPRVLVNLVDFLNPSVLRQVFLGNPDKCPVQQASILCNCVLTLRENSQELARLEAFSRAYQSSLRELVESGRYDTREDFSVVLQPFFQNVQLPVLADGLPDTSFFAPDCIHPSQKFHSQLARALWTNMLEPLGSKTETLDLRAEMPITCPTQNEPFLRTPRNSNYTYPTKPAIENWGSDFLCTEWKASSSVPTSVHELRPADVKVVAALGDSLTTAVGARPNNSSDLPTSWRGLSWSIGGDGNLETHTTLPNILKKFNPYLLGFSTGTWEGTAGLNVAAEGARDLLSPQDINLEKDWKLVTLFTGVNDLCHYCENPEAHLATEYVQHIQQALDILSEELPRAFVNVVEVMELASLYQGQGGKCAMLAAQNNCTCLRHLQSFLEKQELKKVNWNLQNGISSFSYWHQYTQREDFAVVVQPFFQNTLTPLNERGDTDLTFFSEDCFHFSDRGHAEMAIALWNNMLEPVGRKTTSNNFTHSRAKLKCPSPESPYLYTLRNSRLLPDQAEEAPEVLYWAVPVAAGVGLGVGVIGTVIWRCRRGGQREDPPMSLRTVAL